VRGLFERKARKAEKLNFSLLKVITLAFLVSHDVGVSNIAKIAMYW
jgi:hypothetical protein